MGQDEVKFCVTLTPSRKDFEKPFSDYIRQQFKKHPDWAMFKVVPPKGWRPCKRSPKLEDVRINTPIRQHVFGKSGSYMCILEEQRGMSAAEFKKMAEGPGKQPPQKGVRGSDELLERAFWSSVTVNPPLYGADTPLSLFDEKLEYGWNFRNLNCLLRQKDVPEIPGVTTPMTYFGMWKSFFGWHKEDVDLYSINYLHMGAPKVWYCCSPRDHQKFEAMAATLFPENAAACPAFIRHKDLLVSPKVLRSFNVPFVQCKQEPGQFVVLNAAAYHAGFNLGFNCAEAVNFALPEWLELGRDCVNCDCPALADGVRLDMGIFFPELRRQDSSSSEEEEEPDSEDEVDSGSDAEEGEERHNAYSSEAEDYVSARGLKRVTLRRGRSSSQQQQQHAAAGAGRPTRARRGAAAAAAAAAGSRKRSRPWLEEEGADGGKGWRSSSSAKQQRGSAPAPVRAPKVPAVSKTARPHDAPRGAVHRQWGGVAEERPLALVERDAASRELRFSLAHRLLREAASPGCVWVGVLEQGRDGLFRPTGQVRCAQLGSQFPRLAHVRSEWVQGDGRKMGWKLLTKESRIFV